jgi:uncharacterized RDD family membrane protein YckC
MGLRVLTEESEKPPLLRLMLHWLALHPLIFHPYFAVFWLLVGFYAVPGGVLLIACIAIALLCLAAPVAAVIFAALDSEHRTIHDRLAGVKVVEVG